MKRFDKEKLEVKRLNSTLKIVSTLKREFGDRDYYRYISNPNNFEEDVFYHNANSSEDAINIIRFGYNTNSLDDNNCGVGRGLYLGRDKNALINFYGGNFNNPKDNTVKILGKFKFVNLLLTKKFKSFIQKANRKKMSIENYVLSLGYDGIRYFDLYATGEEFVLFNISKCKFQQEVMNYTVQK